MYIYISYTNAAFNIDVGANIASNQYLLASILSGTQNRQLYTGANPSMLNNNNNTSSDPMSMAHRQNELRHPLPLNASPPVESRFGKANYNNNNISLKTPLLDEAQAVSNSTNNSNNSMNSSPVIRPSETVNESEKELKDTSSSGSPVDVNTSSSTAEVS
jgi:hypothetical protein